MTTEEFPGSAPDPRLAEALRSLGDEPPLHEVDWERLRGSIAARAELPLARRRAGAAGSGRRLRPLIPLAAAASVALAVWVGAGRVAQGPAETAQLSAEEVLRPDLTEQEFRLLVSGGADPEALLRIALEGS